MIKQVSCCRGCTPETGRSVEPNCHTYCEKYLAETLEREKERTDIRKQKEFINMCNEVKIRGIKKMQKRRNGNGHK